MWIPAFSDKPYPYQRVRIKLVCLTETEGVYDFNKCMWVYDAIDPLMSQVIAWKHIEGKENVKPKLAKSVISEPYNYA